MSAYSKAFVLMPFNPEFKSIYDDLIKPALQDAGYDVKRADSFLDQRNILRDIVKGISEADLVLADLTSANSNVFYELGLCHGLRVPTVLIAQSMEEVPFDLRSYRIVTYSIRFDEVHKLKQALKEIGEKQNSGEITFESPITDFDPIGSRPQLAAKVGQIHAQYVQGSIVDEDEGFLDWIVAVNDAGTGIATILGEITQSTNNMTARLENHIAKIQALTNNPSPGSAVEAHAIVLAASKDMNTLAETMEERKTPLEKQIETLTNSFSNYVGWMQLTSHELREQANTYRKGIFYLLENVKKSIVGTKTMLVSTQGLRKQGLSRDLDLATRRLSKVLDNHISCLDKMEAFCVRILSIIDDKLSNHNT